MMVFSKPVFILDHLHKAGQIILSVVFARCGHKEENFFEKIHS